MTRSWRLLVVATVLCAALGTGTAAAQTVLARHVPAGEQVDVMLNGKLAGSGKADATGDAKIPIRMHDAIGKTEIDANIYVDRCDTAHRVWIVEVGTAAPSEGTCNLRAVSGLYWVRPVNTIVVNDVMAAAPSLLLLKGDYTPPEPGAELRPDAPAREFPRGLVLFGGPGLIKTNDSTAYQCGDVTGCTTDESGWGYTLGAEYRFSRFLSAEASYLKPPSAKTAGAESTFRFTTEQKANVWTFGGKLAVPVGIARLYGRGGGNYHQAKIETVQTQDPRNVTVDGNVQTIPGGTQTFQLKTDGWGWQFGGGLEIWPNETFAIYGEFGYTSLKGDDVDGGDAKIDNRIGSIIVGLRVHIGG